MTLYKEPLYSQSYIDNGEGQPIILLHGLFGNITMWRSTINALRPDYRVIVPRLPLYEVPVHRANTTSLVEILDDFVTWHQLKSVTLVGTDTGGEAALRYAYEYPDKVKRVILSGSSGLMKSSPAIDNEKDYDSIRNKVSDAFFKKGLVRSSLIDKVYEDINTVSKSLRIAEYAKSSRKNDISKFLYKLQQPVLLIWGLQDKITPPEVALHLHDLLKTSTVKFIDECGHLPMIENPATYIKHIVEFLKG
jgi:pimeloyl-ACP methyl ester carboxylesterase